MDWLTDIISSLATTGTAVISFVLGGFVVSLTIKIKREKTWAEFVSAIMNKVKKIFIKH